MIAYTAHADTMTFHYIIYICFLFRRYLFVCSQLLLLINWRNKMTKKKENSTKYLLMKNILAL